MPQSTNIADDLFRLTLLEVWQGVSDSRNRSHQMKDMKPVNLDRFSQPLSTESDWERDERIADERSDEKADDREEKTKEHDYERRN